MTNMTSRLAARMRGIAPFRVMEILARARELEAEGRSIVHMEIGEPDFPTPEPVCRAGAAALARGELFYTPALGLPALREAIAGFYHTRHGVDVAPSRIIVTPGASGALLLALSVLVDAGEEVLLADPGYPANRHFVRLLEGEPVGVAVGPDSGYQLTPELVEARWSSRTAVVLAATPSNPTGTLIPASSLRAMAHHAARHGGALIVDEIYHGLVYGADCTTALAVADEAFVINSFSKYFNMTGWRLGWLVAPERYVPVIDRLAQNIFLSAPTPSQYAALAAFEPGTLSILEDRRAEFQARRDYLVPALRELGFGIAQMPQGAFYIYAECSRLTDDSHAFTRTLLEEAGVAITPGIDFGTNAPECHVRFAYTRTIGELAEGVRRIGAFLRTQRRAGA